MKNIDSLQTHSCDSTKIEIAVFHDGFLNEEIENCESDDYSGALVGGESVCRKGNVNTPAFTIMRAAQSNGRDMTIVVCPGGGYNILAYDLEGTEVCKMLNDNGYDVALLKYRVPRRAGREKHAAPLEDLQRTISLLRANASQYGINVGRIGVIGFSAGAHLTVMSCCSDRSYQPMDDVDKYSCRPDFCALIYPAYLVSSTSKFTLSDEVSVSVDTPPTFIVQSEDDHYCCDNALFYYHALKEAKVPAEMHLYSSGGHGYGIRITGDPSQEWSKAFLSWLKQRV